MLEYIYMAHTHAHGREKQSTETVPEETQDIELTRQSS